MAAAGPMAWASLEGLTALVTGAGSGIGRASSLSLAAAGAKVALTELPHKMELADETVAAIEAAGGRALALPLDVLDVPSIGPCVQAAAEFGDGRLDILVNNAGLNVPKLAFDVTEEDWDRVLDVNLQGRLLRRPGGRAGDARPIAAGRQHHQHGQPDGVDRLLRSGPPTAPARRAWST